MADPLYAHRGWRGAKVGLAWAGTLESTVAYISGGYISEAAWRLFLDRIRRSRRPLLIRLDDDAALDARAREELAEAIGQGSKVAVLMSRPPSLPGPLSWKPAVLWFW